MAVVVFVLPPMAGIFTRRVRSDEILAWDLDGGSQQIPLTFDGDVQAVPVERTTPSECRAIDVVGNGEFFAFGTATALSSRDLTENRCIRSGIVPLPICWRQPGFVNMRRTPTGSRSAAISALCDSRPMAKCWPSC